jgi:hypothetical protein
MQAPERKPHYSDKIMPPFKNLNYLAILKFQKILLSRGPDDDSMAIIFAIQYCWMSKCTSL